MTVLCLFREERIVEYKMRPKNGLEMILSLPSSPDRDKLLHYLIFVGASPTENANANWKKEYDEIKHNLNNALKKALMCFHQVIATQGLPSELFSGIVLNLIRSECPHLKDFPEQLLLRKIALGV